MQRTKKNREAVVSLSFKMWGIYAVPLFVIIGFLLAYTQPFGLSRDYEQYVLFFNLLASNGLAIFETSRFETGFIITAFILQKFIESNLLLYSILAFGAIFIKGAVFNFISSNLSIFFVISIIYLLLYFPLYEFTQLRAAWGISFLLLAAILVWVGKWPYGLLACASALMFHTSVAAVFPVLFFQPTSRLSIVIIGFCTFVGIFLSSHLLSNYLANYSQAITMYQENGFGDIKANPFSVALLIDWTAICLSLIWWGKYTELMKRIIFIQVIGMALFYGFIEYQVIAHRLKEMYNVFWVFFVIDGLKIIALPTTIFIILSVGWNLYILFSRDYFIPG